MVTPPSGGEYLMDILLLTVPHSATCYVRNSFKFTKYGTHLQVGQPANSPSLYHAHFYESSMPRAARHIKKGVKPLVILRDPLATFATHWDRDWTTTNTWERSHLLMHYENQNKFVEEHGGKILPIERTTLEDIGEWAGVTLKEGAANRGQDTPLKRAIKQRDAAAIEDILGEDWEWFKTTLTPVIASLYTRHGYDLWWNNG